MGQAQRERSCANLLQLIQISDKLLPKMIYKEQYDRQKELLDSKNAHPAR